MFGVILFGTRYKDPFISYVVPPPSTGTYPFARIGDNLHFPAEKGWGRLIKRRPLKEKLRSEVLPT